VKEFNGRYLGFSPTDESAVGVGEMEVVINADKIKIRMATGLEIKEEEYLVEDFRRMTSEEIAALMYGRNVFDVELRAFRHSTDLPELLFFEDKKSKCLILWFRWGGVGESFGPTVLLSCANGTEDFDLCISKLEKMHGKNLLPRLRNNGKAEN